MKVTVIGAGNSGLAMASYMSRNGHEVTLWNRTKSVIEELISTPFIQSEGVFNDSVALHRVTSDIQCAVQDPDVIFITTPASAHKELAKLIAISIKKETLIVLNPGRTFGALEFRMTFEKFNKQSKPLIAEAQTIIFTCRKVGPSSVHVIALKPNVLVSTFDARQNENIIGMLPECIRDHFIPAKSMIETSIGNIGMILHCAPLLLNAGWTENETNRYKYYYDGITPTISRFLEKMDAERVATAAALGHPVESTSEWMKRTYEISGASLYDCLQNNEAYRLIDAPRTLSHRYILEDVPCGLVPIEEVGKMMQLDMSCTTLVIDLSSKLMETDFRQSGRNLKSIGYISENHDFRNYMDSLICTDK